MEWSKHTKWNKHTKFSKMELCKHTMNFKTAQHLSKPFGLHCLQSCEKPDSFYSGVNRVYGKEPASSLRKPHSDTLSVMRRES